MKKMFAPLVAIILLFYAATGYAADLFSVGKSGDNNLVNITKTGVLQGARGSYEAFTTSGSTLTAIESGKTLVLTPAGSDVNFTLPTASLGLTYTFVHAGGTANYITVTPQSTDTIEFAGTMAAGDKLKSGAATADSLTVISYTANKWAISAINGTWTDAN